jgi:hypothetical protein
VVAQIAHFQNRSLGGNTMSEAKTRLLEILKSGYVYWQDDTLPNGGQLKIGKGPVNFLKEHDNGNLTFSCGGWSSTIEVDDGIEISGKCVATYRTAESGLRWLCVYAPITAQDEVADVMKSRMKT